MVQCRGRCVVQLLSLSSSRLVIAVDRSGQAAVLLDRDRVEVALGDLARVRGATTFNFLGRRSATVNRRGCQTDPTLNLMHDWCAAAVSLRY